MRATRVVIARHGGPDVLEVREEDVPAPGPGQVRVRVRAAGINFAEVFCRLGLYRYAPPPPFVPGFEFAGEVADVGPGVAFRAGQRVLGVVRFGGYSGALVAEAARVRPIPAGWSFEEAAAFPAAALTAAYGLIEPGRLREGEVVLVHSAAGGVGTCAVQIARAVGARVVGTVGSPAKLRLPADLGCEWVIDRSESPWWDAVRERVGPVDLVFDALGGRGLRRGYELLRPGGRLVVYGLGLMTPRGDGPNWLLLGWQRAALPSFSPFDLIGDNKTVSGFNVLVLWDEVARLGALLDRCLGWAEEGKLRPHIGEAAPYTEAGRLHRALQDGATTGKLVITFPEPVAAIEGIK